MDYSRFLRLRQPLWDEFESNLGSAKKRHPALTHESLEKLAFQYRQILHDYAIASTRFARTGVADRLHRLALDGNHWLLAGRLEEPWSLRRFATRSFPLAFRQQVPFILIACVIFATAALLGGALALVQPGMAMSLLGPEAVADLDEGRLWTEALSTTVPPAISSSSIATNNLSVAILAWAGGALFGLGSTYVVLLNGFLLGAMLGVTVQYSLFGRLIEFVSAHGPLEITIILVSAGAGLAMGHAMVEAGDRSRGDALLEAARSALTLLLGSLPWLIVLAVVEGLISPAPAISASVKLLLGLSLEGLFLTFAWNPFLPIGQEQ